MSEAKNTLSALLDLVRAGETVVIADRGTPVARLEAVQAVPGSAGSEARLARLERSGLLRRGEGRSLDALRGPLPRVAPGRGRAALEVLSDERGTGR